MSTNDQFFYSDLAKETDDVFVYHLLWLLSAHDNDFLQQTAKDFLFDRGILCVPMADRYPQA